MASVIVRTAAELLKAIQEGAPNDVVVVKVPPDLKAAIVKRLAARRPGGVALFTVRGVLHEEGPKRSPRRPKSHPPRD